MALSRLASRPPALRASSASRRAMARPATPWPSAQAPASAAGQATLPSASAPRTSGPLEPSQAGSARPPSSRQWRRRRRRYRPAAWRGQRTVRRGQLRSWRTADARARGLDPVAERHLAPPAHGELRDLGLPGRSTAKWRERIGNAVPPQSAQPMAERMLATLVSKECFGGVHNGNTVFRGREAGVLRWNNICCEAKEHTWRVARSGLAETGPAW